MAKPAAAVQPIELDCADDGIALQMTRWLSHLRAERRLSPKTLEAYARDVRQCLAFLGEHWGARVTLTRFAALEASDVSAFMAMRRADDIGGRSLMRALAGLRSFGAFPRTRRQGQGRRACRRSARPRSARACRSRSRWRRPNVSPMPTSAPARTASPGSGRATPP